MTSEQLEALKNQAAGRWPVPSAKVEQLFAVMESAIQEARDQALEDAARCATSRSLDYIVGHSDVKICEDTAKDIAEAIRAMKGKSE